MKSHRASDGERSLAVFIDFENMGLGFNNRRDRFEIGKVLERLVEKGKIVCKKAYADWSRFGMYTGGLHEAAIELIEIPRRGMTGKNSADIRLVVDAVDLAYSKDHIDTFVIVSGDSDFSPLVSKLKELGKHVIGLGLSDATSDLLRDNCDEFIYYEDLDRAPIIPVSVNDSIPEKKRKVFALLLDSLLALRRENKEVIYSSMLKDTIKRKKPSFNEGYYGYRTFSELLEDAQREGLLELEKHRTSGMYVVTRFGLELKSGPVAAPAARIVQLPVRNGGEPKKVAELPPRSSTEPKKVVELPPRPAEPKRVVEVPKPVTLAEKRLVAPPVPPKPALLPKPIPPADDREDERPLGRALADEFDPLDDDPLDEVPSYAPRKVETKPAAKPAKEPAAKPAKEPAKEPAKAKAPAKSAAKPATRTARPAKEAPPAKAPAAKPAVEKPPAAKPPVEKPPVRKSEAKPLPPANDDDEFGAGL
ncbi:NYN domain-containing protein [Frigoriglobus tundricola]|uniref:Maebl n=1 Tax=Frigoriglobus tundricola TaxID=2774151 RepID=A0A6M5YKK8_9BACT|nr:NYN domain-containing protein [Frigoriglobus tundricola]QJW93831.1 Maebl [Frigoriglobus tundricola]